MELGLMTSESLYGSTVIRAIDHHNGLGLLVSGSWSRTVGLKCWPRTVGPDILVSDCWPRNVGLGQLALEFWPRSVGNQLLA